MRRAAQLPTLSWHGRSSAVGLPPCSLPPQDLGHVLDGGPIRLGVLDSQQLVVPRSPPTACTGTQQGCQLVCPAAGTFWWCWLSPFVLHPAPPMSPLYPKPICWSIHRSHLSVCIVASTKLTNIDGNLPRDVLLIALRTNMPQVFRWCLHAVGSSDVLNRQCRTTGANTRAAFVDSASRHPRHPNTNSLLSNSNPLLSESQSTTIPLPSHYHPLPVRFCPPPDTYVVRTGVFHISWSGSARVSSFSSLVEKQLPSELIVINPDIFRLWKGQSSTGESIAEISPSEAC